MWTLAASLSYQVQYLRESLYRCALKLLESLEAGDNVIPCIEQIQTSIHIVVYEGTRLMRLHEPDSPPPTVPMGTPKKRSGGSFGTLAVVIAHSVTLRLCSSLESIPLPLAECAEFFSSHRYLDSSNPKTLDIKLGYVRPLSKFSN
ncbi:hypothetical protein LTS17_009098 [Exophiala oligosperma]